MVAVIRIEQTNKQTAIVLNIQVTIVN